MRIHVFYNGVEAVFQQEPEHLVHRLFGAACVYFKPVYKTNRLAFFTADGRELERLRTLEESGVHDEEKLLLRPTVI